MSANGTAPNGHERPGPYGVIMPGLDRWKEHGAPAIGIERMDMKFGDKASVEACLGVSISKEGAMPFDSAD